MEETPQIPILALKLYTDRCSCVKDLGERLVLTSPNRGESLRYAMVLPFKTTKNEAEYEALIVGLGIAK